MESPPLAASVENTSTSNSDVILVSQRQDIDCDIPPIIMTTHKTNIDNNNELTTIALERIESSHAPQPPASLSTESTTSQSILPSTSLNADSTNSSITTNKNDGNNNNNHDNNHTSQSESNIKLKRCKHGRIIIKDLSKKKLPTATANESFRNIIKNTSSNLSIESNQQSTENAISSLSAEDSTTKQSTVAITESPTRSPKETKPQSISPPPVDRPSRSEKTSESSSSRETKDGRSPKNVKSNRSREKSPRRRRRDRSRSRSGSRTRHNRSKARGKSPLRYSPSPPPRPTSSGRRSPRSISKSRGRSPYRLYDSPRRRDRSSPQRKRDKRYIKDNRHRSPRRRSYRQDSPRRSKSPRARRSSGSLSPEDRDNSNSYGRHRQDRRSPPRDHPRERYGRKDLYDEVQPRSLLEECKTRGGTIETGVAGNYVTKNQLLYETQKAASLADPTIKPPAHQNHNAPYQSNASHPPSDPVRSSPSPPPPTVSSPPPKNTHSNSSSRGSSTGPSPATPSNNSISSDIYDPEGPILPISPGDSPPLSPLSDIEYPKPPIEYRPNDGEKNGDDDVPSSAVQLNHQEKYLQKLNRQERVIEEVKIALRPYYQNRSISKEQYKDVLRRAVPKICHSKKGEINPIKIRALVEAYVGKMKRQRS